jgi:hypothetical protein
MRRLAPLLVAAFLLTLACGQLPSVLPAGEPTLAPAADGNGLARVSATPAERSETAQTPRESASPQPSASAEVTDPAEANGVPQATNLPEPSETPETIPSPQATDAPLSMPPGALVRVTMPGEAGVLLDEFPPQMRDRVARALIEQSDEMWEARARRQIGLTRLRLNFRDSHAPGKGQLPLTHPSLWSMALDEAGPRRVTLQGHDLVMLRYTMTTTILSDPDSVAAAEPALTESGGVWEEYFLLPADPDFLLQRTGRACLNDDGFPPNSIDAENAGHFYDYDRTSCLDALVARVGAVETRLRFQRLPWDPTIADRARLFPPQSDEGADLQVVGEDLEINRLTYRFFGERDCALQEGAVGAPGWRRLLQFEATVHNVGNAPMHVGWVNAGGEESVFEFAPCHDHVHYRHYGIFTLDDGDGLALGELGSSKQAFCVQSTDRPANHELSPLTHDYSCRFQGIQTGWADEYIAGLDTQWIDVTDVEVGPDGRTLTLGFISNPEGFLCEGQAAFDERGRLLWEPSGLTTDEGEPILRPQCDFAQEWDANNVETRQVFIPPTGSLLTAPCANGELGPLRNCGFQELELSSADASCRVSQPYSLRLALQEESPPMVVRACERSAVLGTGIACAYEDAVANVVVPAAGDATTMTLTCPPLRDGDDGQGNIALYAAPLWPEDEGNVQIGD